MIERLRRHPVPMATRFGHSVVLSYALPAAVLAPLLPAGLRLDTYSGFGFVAIGVVSTRRLRPAYLPSRIGLDAVLVGYRIMTAFGTPTGRTMRGLYVLRSDTDRRLLRLGANALTRYHYHQARIRDTSTDTCVRIDVSTVDGRAELALRADISAESGLPEGSPFATMGDARRFAGPLPYTFDHEPSTGSIVVVKAFRSAWRPRPVAVTVPRPGFLVRGPFAGTRPVLANAFHVADLDYGWHRGRAYAPDGSPR
ncbi:hypothetical protein Athai_39240 [Actinocatenispora thailandica]|uniref:Uncharacterized protein n=1 Tax=Actinocatenispora thailandica TaxID=227318 RepID=A0A7R7DRM0_9ACTN|nr:DUF2071 domain-containing protein [Actinocatenispora thailandica]BCJ36421.1 hypothetical protein Athai_39240 [Actinocatenispora thailandica]